MVKWKNNWKQHLLLKEFILLYENLFLYSDQTHASLYNLSTGNIFFQWIIILWKICENVCPETIKTILENLKFVSHYIQR
jgi:uncharacterized membrane protein